ncbi:hypothetical protein AB0L75_25030 [Streptomyces sp. NPDC052101]|uniref:hypothetical protein n=1 Tax=Streptomyces sp. NPDC052101 TaxID=3155763 RepID=UPI003426BAFD
MPSWTGRMTKAVVAGSIAVAGVVTGTGTAHSDPATDCRAGSNSPTVNVTKTISIGSCYYVEGNGYTIWGWIPYQNNSGSAVTYCAHAIDVHNPGGPWAHDFGCDHTTADKQGMAYPGRAEPYRSWGWQTWDAPAGSYVISAGFWLNGHYLGDVESPKTTIGRH